MGLFDFLSGEDEAAEAAEATRAALTGYGIDVNRLYDQYRTQTVGALGDARTRALDELERGFGEQTGAYGRGISAIEAGREGALGAGRAGVDAYTPLRETVAGFQPAIDAYYAALGLRGPEAAAGQYAGFQKTPGYQFEVDEATLNAMANASRLGIAGSGNTLQALGDRAQGIAGTRFGEHLARLGAFAPLQLTGATALGAGLSGANRTLADIYSQSGRDVAGIYGQQAGAYGQAAGARAGLQSGYGTDVGNVLGNVTAGQTQSLRDITTGNIQANQAIAQAGQQDAANFWGLLGAGTKALGTAFASDRRVKNSVRQIGELFDGTPVYRFRYNGHPAVHVGLMAQDVEKDRPQAVIEINGVKHVDYDLATRGVGR